MFPASLVFDRDMSGLKLEDGADGAGAAMAHHEATVSRYPRKRGRSRSAVERVEWITENASHDLKVAANSRHETSREDFSPGLTNRFGF